MRRLLVLACALAMAMALAGCGSNNAASSSANEPSASESLSSAAQSASSEESDEEAEDGADQGTVIDWTEVASSAEAAKGAGFDGFDVMDEVTIGDMTFKNPAFAYADGTAQAWYEEGAAAIYIRKAVGIYGAPLSDREYGEFAAKWTQNHKGLEIDCYGAEEGAATLIQWNVGDEAFAATYQGLGGDEMTMDPDDITSLVSGIQ